MSSGYTPIECGLHSEYELLAMHRKTVQLVYATSGGQQMVTATVVDIVTRKDGEFMVLQAPGAADLRVRLDKIIRL